MISSDNDGEADAPEHDVSTRQLIIDTALKLLGRNGYRNLTTRAIAREAGINQALINYHFGTKENLLLEMLRALDSGKYGRQADMHHEPDVPLSQKWRQAVDFYRKDLDDGYVRITQELLVLGATNPAVGERTLALLNRWHTLLKEVAAAYGPALGLDVPSSFVATAVGAYWIGMSSLILAGSTEEDGHYFELLDRIGDWLEERERQFGESEPSQPAAAQAMEEKD